MIDYQGQVDASGDNQWVRVYDWEFVPGPPVLGLSSIRRASRPLERRTSDHPISGFSRSARSSPC